MEDFEDYNVSSKAPENGFMGAEKFQSYLKCIQIQSGSESRQSTSLTSYESTPKFSYPYNKKRRLNKKGNEKSGEFSSEDYDGNDGDASVREAGVEGENNEAKNDRPRKGKKKGRFGGFIIDEAEVDDEVDEDDAWEVGELEPTARDIEIRTRGSNLWDTQRDDEIEEYLRKKYADESIAGQQCGDSYKEISDEITYQTLLPDIKDPHLWMVKCRVGEEKAMALFLMRKYLTYLNTDEPLQIKSVVVPKGVKGYIYIESYKQTHVKVAIENVGNLRMGKFKQEMVPIKEMPDILKVVRKETVLKEKQWVRPKRGLYKDDIAQVDYVDLAENQAHIKLVPRIDYTKMRGALNATSSEQEYSQGKKRRPPTKLFDPQAIRAIGGEVRLNGDYLVFKGCRYSREGFLYKKYNIASLLIDGVKPTLSELKIFEEKRKDLNIANPTSEDPTVSHSFSMGDNVEVCVGDLENLQAKIIAIDGNMITVTPKHEDLKDPILFEANELRKYFATGDHARILAGRHRNETGLIIRAEPTRVVLISDLSNHELEVLPRDLQLCADVSTGLHSLGRLQWGDLVQFDPQIVGVIIFLEREVCKILIMNGGVIECKPDYLNKLPVKRNTVALDANQNQIGRRDIVQVLDGPYAGRSGEIKHLYRGVAFLHCRMYSENGGIFACKTDKLLRAGGIKPKKNYWGSFSNMRVMSPRKRLSGQRSGGTCSGSASSHREKSRFIPNHNIIGKTVKICGGPYKSFVGIVKNVTTLIARVELHTICQTISVSRKRITIVKTSRKHTTVSSPKCDSVTPMYTATVTQSTPCDNQTPYSDSEEQTLSTSSAMPLGDNNMEAHHEAWDPRVINIPCHSNDSSKEPVWNEEYDPPTPSSQVESANNADPSPNDSKINETPSETLSDYSPSSSAYSPKSTVYSPAPSTYSSSAPCIKSKPKASLDTLKYPLREWCSPNVEVKIHTHNSSDLIGKIGTVRSVSNDVCSVFLCQDDRNVSVVSEYLTPVLPTAGQRFKIIQGDNRGATGKVLCEAGGASFCDINGSSKLIPTHYLCKMNVTKQLDEC